MTLSNNLVVNKSGPLLGNIKIPGDKSISHRSIILGSLAEGEMIITNFLESDDCQCTINAMKNLGAEISFYDKKVFIRGNGLFNLKAPQSEIDAGNSGTLMRLLTGLLSVQNFKSSITGDESLLSRPMERIIKPLSNYGADIESRENKAPLIIKPTKELNPIDYHQEIASAQIKSCLMFASLFINGKSRFYEEIPTRDHTENLLEHLGYNIERTAKTTIIHGQKKILARDIQIASDISSASFFIVAALISRDSEISLKNINMNKYRTGIVTILEKMGAKIDIDNIKTISNELVGDLKVKSSKLRSIEISGEIISSLIDELPIIFIACALSEGVSKISGIEELRYKESDRIKTMEEGLKSIGIDVSSTQDSITISGGKISGGKVNSYGDHRVAMSFAIAGIVSDSSISISNTKNISTSFPSFVNLLREQGVQIFEI